MPATITAAGGVIWRATPSGPEIAAIHRPHRGDWSLPKGKLAKGERRLAAAHREVVEETGLDVAVQQYLGSIRYRTGGAAKTVHYWAMRLVGGKFTPNAEADDLEWLSPERAEERLTYDADRSVVAQFVEAGPADSAVLLVRHARAGKRSAWKKADELRPIDRDGRRQAQSIADAGSLFRPTAVVAATPLRCRQTVEPLAERMGLTVDVAPEFSDTDFARSPRRARRALAALTDAGRVSVVCSQGEAIPGLLDLADPKNAPHDSRKASTWVLFFADGELLAADYYGRAGMLSR